MFIIFFLGALIFGSSKILCIIGMILTAGLTFLNIFSMKGMWSKKLQQMTSIGYVIIFAISMLTGISIKEGGLLYYEQQIGHIRNLIEKDKITEARNEINEFKRDYGNSDNVVMLEALAFVGDRKFKDAISHLNNYSDKTSIEYYLILESIYFTENNPNEAGNLRKLYIDAASRYPQWAYMQKMAGISQLDNGNYPIAEYLLLRAYDREPLDYETVYYLGVACYGQNRIEDALEYFDETIHLGADDKILGHIAWYAEQVTK